MGILRGINIGNIFDHYRIGNAQIIGNRKFQCNYISSAYDKHGSFIVALSDGTIDHPNGCIAAEIAAEYCIKALKKKHLSQGTIFI